MYGEVRDWQTLVIQSTACNVILSYSILYKKSAWWKVAWSGEAGQSAAWICLPIQQIV
jgi:hypothetical protein